MKDIDFDQGLIFVRGGKGAKAVSALFDKVVGPPFVLFGEGRGPDTVERDVMIGQDEAISRREHARAVTEAIEEAGWTMGAGIGTV